MNAILANMKIKKGIEVVPFDSKERRFEGKKQNVGYICPGEYAVKSDFDVEAIDTKPNLIPSKVIYLVGRVI